MGQIERIEVKRIYVGRAAMFGLFFGLIIGFIVGIIFLIIGLWFTNFLNNISVLGGNSSLPITTGGKIMYSFTLIVFYTIGSCIIFVVGALLYNLIAKIGFTIHLGLAELAQFN